MYERFEPSDDVFVDREEYLSWMDDALQRCKEKSPVLHLRGIGGIGKSSLLDYWTKKIESTIRLDCLQYSEFFSRLEILARGAIRLGVSLQRFDILWHIRKRFVEGVEPAAEKGRTWAKEVLVAIPFIGSLATIGAAIKAVGDKVAPKFKSKYGEVGQWLQDRLGNQYIEKLLEILWKDPRHAEFLYLDALLEDINNRKGKDPILLLLDHFENVDTEEKRWRYSGMKITEADLWYVFLTSLSNCVGVVASRNLAPEIEVTAGIEKDELTELDRDSCIEMLDLQGVENKDLQEKIISISGGNPFIIDAICDILNAKEITNGDIERLRAGSLDEVRLKTWRKLFSEVKDLTEVVDKAGLLPFFDKRVMDIIIPDIKTDQYERLLRLSFVRNRGDGTYVLHDLARELVISELGNQLEKKTNEIGTLLENASKEEEDFTLMGISFSVLALSDADKTSKKLLNFWISYGNQPVQHKLLEMLKYVEIDSEKGWFTIHLMKGWMFTFLKRTAEAENIILETIEKASGKREYQKYLALAYHTLSVLYYMTSRYAEMEDPSRESLHLYRELYDDAKSKKQKLDYPTLVFYANNLRYLSFLQRSRSKLSETEEVLQEMLSLVPEFPKSDAVFTQDAIQGEALITLSSTQLAAGHVEEAEKTARMSVEGEYFHSSDQYMQSLILWRLGDILSTVNKHIEAEKMLREACNIINDLYEKEPEGFYWINKTGYAQSLAYAIEKRGKFKEAENLFKGSLKLAREHVGDESIEFLGWRLLHYGDFLVRARRYSEAEPMYNEGIEIIKKFAESQPMDYKRHLSDIFNNHAVLLRNRNRFNNAESFYLEALEIGRPQSEEFPESVFITYIVSTILNNMGVLFNQTNRISAGEESYLEALQIWRDVVEKSPVLFNNRLSVNLNNYGVMLSGIDRLSESERIFQESLEIKRQLAEQGEGLEIVGVASVLNNIGNLLKKLERFEEAQAAFKEACEIYEEVIKNVSERYIEDLKRTLGNLRLLLMQTESPATSIQTIESRLKELGVSDFIEQEEWFEEEIII